MNNFNFFTKKIDKIYCLLPYIGCCFIEKLFINLWASCASRVSMSRPNISVRGRLRVDPSEDEWEEREELRAREVDASALSDIETVVSANVAASGCGITSAMCERPKIRTIGKLVWRENFLSVLNLDVITAPAQDRAAWFGACCGHR
jgi:hypothetical protein